MKNPFGDGGNGRYFRIVPEIEKNPRLVALVQTLWGRLLVVILFLVILSSIHLSHSTASFSYIELIAIFSLGFLPLGRLPKLCFALLLFYMSGPRVFRGLMSPHQAQNAIAAPVFRQLNEQLSGAFVLNLALALAVLLLLNWMCLRFLSLVRTRFPAMWLFLIWILLMCGVLQLPPNTLTATLAWLVVAGFSVCLSAIAFYHTARSAFGKSGFLEWAYFSLQNLMVASPFVFLRHPDLLKDGPNREALAVCRLKALKLVFWARLALLMQDLIFVRVFSVPEFAPWVPVGERFRLHWPTYSMMGLADYNALHVGWTQLWATVLINNIYFLYSISAQTGIYIAIFRLAGIYLPRAVCRPYRARSFNDYFRRTLFYYSEIIVHLFFFPIYIKLSFLRGSRRLRIVLALFFGLLAGGLIFHSIFVWQTFLVFGAEIALQNIISWVPYFALVALMCSVSATGVISSRMKRAPQFIHFAINFTLQALLLLLIQYYVGETWGNRLEFMQRLFGL